MGSTIPAESMADAVEGVSSATADITSRSASKGLTKRRVLAIGGTAPDCLPSITPAGPTGDVDKCEGRRPNG